MKKNRPISWIGKNTYIPVPIKEHFSVTLTDPSCRALRSLNCNPLHSKNMLSASPFAEVNPPAKTSFFSKKRSSANFDSDPANKFGMSGFFFQISFLDSTNASRPASRPSTPPTDDPELEEQLNDSQTSLQPLSDDVLKSLCQFEVFTYDTLRKAYFSPDASPLDLTHSS